MEEGRERERERERGVGEMKAAVVNDILFFTILRKRALILSNIAGNGDNTYQ